MSEEVLKWNVIFSLRQKIIDFGNILFRFWAVDGRYPQSHYPLYRWDESAAEESPIKYLFGKQVNLRCIFGDRKWSQYSYY